MTRQPAPVNNTFVAANVKPNRRIVLVALGLVAVTVLGIGSIWGQPSHSPTSHAKTDSGRGRGKAGSLLLRVDIVHPEPGGCARTVELPGTVRPFDYANLYSRVSGFLKTQGVDIGDQVKKGQLLAELDVPDIEQELQRNRAELGLAEAQVKQKEAAVLTAQAEADVAASMVAFAEAEVGRTVAATSFREKQYNRMKDLSGMKAIDERLVDEKQDEHESAISAQKAAVAKVATSKSEVAASVAKVEEARANLEEAKSKVAVAKTIVQKSEVQLAYSKIISPYDGVVTDRAFHLGDFIQSADDGNRKPILQVQKVDVMRLIVQMPDRDVAYTDVGDRAEFKVDALGGEVRKGSVSRYANSEDERTRSMRTEVDLKNPDGKLRDGMYGQVVLYLQDANPNAVHIPSACLVGRTKVGGAKVFVCVDGKLRLTPIKTGNDNGVVVEVTEGLTTDSQVVFAPGGDLVDGAAVEPTLKASGVH